MTVEPRSNAGRAAGRAPPRFGLSGKLLLLTILFVMIAEVLIYVPSIANFRLNWLADRVAVARTVSIVLNASKDGRRSERAGRNQAARERGPADSRQPRRQDGGDQDGQPAQAARRQRHAARRSITTSTCAIPRCCAPCGTRCDTLFFCSDSDVMRVVGPGAAGRRLHRDRDRGGAAAPGDVRASRATSCCSR